MSGEVLGVVLGIAPPGTVVSGGVPPGTVDPPGVVDPPGTGVVVGSVVGVGVLWAKELETEPSPVKAIELITRDAIKDFFMTRMSSDIRKQQGLVK